MSRPRWFSFGPHPLRNHAAIEFQRRLHISGERNGNHKLTLLQVREIRSSALPYWLLTQIYGICKAQVYRVRNGRDWGRITLREYRRRTNVPRGRWGMPPVNLLQLTRRRTA